MKFPYSAALIVGAGSGISAAAARHLAKYGVKVALAARNIEKLDALVQDTGAHAIAADAADPDSVADLFEQATQRIGEPEIVIYNAGARLQGSVAELDPHAVQKALATTAFGGFLGDPSGGAAHAAARPRRNPAHRSDGERQGVREFRGLCHGQICLARTGAECGARIWGRAAFMWRTSSSTAECARCIGPTRPANPTACWTPTRLRRAISTCLRQPRSAWSQEVELRPWVEHF